MEEEKKYIYNDKAERIKKMNRFYIGAVSYTHLDVYKRQEKLRSEIRDNAYQTFCTGHTWRARAKEILSWEAED